MSGYPIVALSCKCGCGEPVIQTSKSRVREFVDRGHAARHNAKAFRTRHRLHQTRAGKGREMVVSF